MRPEQARTVNSVDEIHLLLHEYPDSVGPTAIVPAYAALGHQPHVRLMNEPGRGQRVSGVLEPQLSLGHAAELFVHQGYDSIHSCGFTRRSLQEKVGCLQSWP